MLTATIEQQNLESKHLIRNAEDNFENVFTVLIYHYFTFKRKHLYLINSLSLSQDSSSLYLNKDVHLQLY